VSDPDGGCGCPFDYEYICPACGHQRITNHCPHDGVQNRCPHCGWTDPGKQTPLQFLGWEEKTVSYFAEPVSGGSERLALVTLAPQPFEHPVHHVRPGPRH